MSFAAPSSRAITLDQLIALNDEIAALARAGVPLERGLKELGRDMPGRLGATAEQIADRLERGESLDRVLAGLGQAYSPAYRAVVAAGLRSGRLAAALEGIAAISRRSAEMRRTLLLASIYPLIVLEFAYGTFVFSVSRLTPVMLDSFASFSPGGESWFPYLRPLYESVAVWAPWPPLIIAAAFALWWRHAVASISTGSGWLQRVSSLGRMRRYGRVATFADILALLVEQHVPLTEAIPLAADASGDPLLLRGASELVQRLERGDVGATENPPAGFPPLLAWLVATGDKQVQFNQSLRRTAADYHDRAAAISDWATVYLPIIMAVVVGGMAVFLQAAILLAPWYKLMFDIAQA